MPESSKITRRRILMLIPELGFGGAEKSFLRLARFLSEYHDVSLAVFKRHYERGNYSKEEEDIDLPLVVLDSDNSSWRLGRWINRWTRLMALKRDSDVTISFLTGANILNVFTGGQGGKVVSMRGSRRYDPAINRVKLLLYEYLIDPLTFRFADSVVSISEGLSAELKSKLDVITQTKINTIELFFDAEQLIASSNEPIEDDFLALKGSSIILSAGRLSPEKGYYHLIEVFAKVHRKVPGAKLFLIGDGPLYQNLIELCNELSLTVSEGTSYINESAVVFLGYRSNPSRYFRVAQLFILSSLTEAFSNITVEALAAGVPVMATDCPWGPRSILWKRPVDVSTPYPTKVPTYADYGVLMPRIDQEEFQQKWVDELIKCLTEHSTIKNYAELGLERVRQLDERLIAQKWLDVVDEVCK